MQMPKSPRENSSGEAVTGGRERVSDERCYRLQERREIGVGEGKKWQRKAGDAHTLQLRGSSDFRKRLGGSAKVKKLERHFSEAESMAYLRGFAEICINKFSSPTR